MYIMLGNQRTLPKSIKLELAKRGPFLSILKAQEMSIRPVGGPSFSGDNRPERTEICHTENSRGKRWNEINRKS